MVFIAVAINLGYEYFSFVIYFSKFFFIKTFFQIFFYQNFFPKFFFVKTFFQNFFPKIFLKFDF